MISSPISACRLKAGRTRPLCPFPKIAKWDGKGPTDEAASFTCEAPGQ
ncbi:tannase/feruloyl esterase family alpha/beta hydrolase [Sphingopyxis sp. PET50]